MGESESAKHERVDAAAPRCYCPVLFPTSSRTLDAVSLYRSRRWLTLAALALSGCGGPFPQSTFAPASGYAREIDGLFGTVFKLMMLVFVVVEVLLLYTIIRHRHRPGAAERGTPTATRYSRSPGPSRRR